LFAGGCWFLALHYACACLDRFSRQPGVTLYGIFYLIIHGRHATVVGWFKDSDLLVSGAALLFFNATLVGRPLLRSRIMFRRRAAVIIVVSICFFALAVSAALCAMVSCGAAWPGASARISASTGVAPVNILTMQPLCCLPLWHWFSDSLLNAWFFLTAFLGTAPPLNELAPRLPSAPSLYRPSSAFSGAVLVLRPGWFLSAATSA